MKINRPSFLDKIDLNLDIQPICALLGPRQVGKTTLAHAYAEENFKEDFYIFDLENPADINRLDSPMLAFSQIKQTLIVIDEIQRRPDLFMALRVIVDNPKNKHKFLILGSASKELIRQSSESLAGRIGYIEVSPFSIGEVDAVEKLWVRGGFPRSYLADSNQKSYLWRQNYINTFLEQDIPNLGFRVPPPQLRRFWMMLANHHGQVFNSSAFGASLGVSNHTARNYLDILVGTFMVRYLEPWFENLEKRQVKSPKIYFRDSGILHNLLNIGNEDQLFRNLKIGASWEGFALEEVIRYAQAEPGECFFWSTQSNAELDLFIIKFGKRLGFEFKYADSSKVTKSMRIALQDLRLDQLFIIIPGDACYLLEEKVFVCGINKLRTLNFSNF